MRKHWLRARARAAIRIVKLAQWMHPEPLVVMVSRDSVKVIPGGYEINIPGTNTPLARVTSGQVADTRVYRGRID